MATIAGCGAFGVSPIWFCDGRCMPFVYVCFVCCNFLNFCLFLSGYDGVGMVVKEFLDRCIAWVEVGEVEVGGGNGLVEYRSVGPLYLLKQVSDGLCSYGGGGSFDGGVEVAASVVVDDLPVVTSVFSYVWNVDSDLPFVTNLYSLA